MGALEWLATRARPGAPGRLSPAGQRLFGPAGALGAALRVWHRPRLEGWERLPRGPFLVVANHSGGGGVDVGTLACLWAERGGEPPLAGLAHPVSFHLPGVAWLLRQLGAIPSSRDQALAALREGVPLLVFPGGDHEAFRPLWQAGRVDWNGRQGFLRLAREAWVPIVPLGLRGSHFAVPILWRSRVLPWLLVLPRLLGLKRFPLTAAGALGAGLILTLGAPHLGAAWAASAAWLWLSLPVHVLLPQLPCSVRAELGPPLPPEALFGEDRQRPLQAAYDDVLGAVQALVRARPAE